MSTEGQGSSSGYDSQKPGWKNPYGDGHAARRMVDVLVEAGLG